MPTEGAETRNYGTYQRELTPKPKERPNFSASLTKGQRLWYARNRLFDKFARTGDTRCRDKAKSIRIDM